MFEVQVYGTTTQWTTHFREAEQAYKESRGDAVLFKFEGSKTKIMKRKRAHGFKLKDIARM